MVKKWMLKAIVQKVISILPFSFRINYFFQRYVTRRVLLSDEFLSTMIDHHQEAIRYWKIHGGEIIGSSIVEIGSGWHPVIPILHYLSGAKQITTLDLRPLLRKQNIKLLLMRLIDWSDSGKLEELMASVDASRVENIKELIRNWPALSLAEILTDLGIRQLIGDVRQVDLESSTFDFCTSVNVFEHLDAADIPTIMIKLIQLTRPGGLHYHAIGTYDHFCHVDRSISKFNYLKYSEKQWHRIDNDIQPQNRLRLSYFRDLFVELGLEIKETLLWDAEPGEIDKIELHEDFRGLDDVDVPYGTFVLMINRSFTKYD